MSWVLILEPLGQPGSRRGWPAVIGGYSTFDEAANAGEIAMAPPYWTAYGGFYTDAAKAHVADMEERFGREWSYQEGFKEQYGDIWGLRWRAYAVIPGAADTPPPSVSASSL